MQSTLDRPLDRVQTLADLTQEMHAMMECGEKFSCESFSAAVCKTIMTPTI